MIFTYLINNLYIYLYIYFFYYKDATAEIFDSTKGGHRKIFLQTYEYILFININIKTTFIHYQLHYKINK